MHFKKLRARAGAPAAQPGFTLVELMVSLIVLAIVSLSLTALFTALVNSAAVAKQKAVASALATNQMEYLKSLPYDSLVVQSPTTTTQTVNGVKYTIKTNIDYVDDAYDGCGSYPTQALKQTYCRNYPPPAGAPNPDLNAGDYKIADVAVYSPGGSQLAEVDTEISARVAETSSNTGALFVTVIDSNGNPVTGATVNVTNSHVGLTPRTDSTDQNGVVIFYDLPADTSGYDYAITASDNGYSTLTTIVPSGSLQPTYSSQKIISQQSSAVTLTLKLQGPDSLLVKTTDTNGNPLPNVKVYMKGGYKKYTATSDTSYCYDNLSYSICNGSGNVTDNRPITDVNGLAGVSNLVPGQYIFCGDIGGTNCIVGGTTTCTTTCTTTGGTIYYLAAALPYSGNNPFNPVNIPTYDPGSPPSTTFAYNSHNYYQEVRLMLTTNANFPRVGSVSPYDVSLTGGTVSNFAFQITGVNLPCSATASSCSTTVKLSQGSNTYTASCTGTGGTQINCIVNLSSAAVGNATLSISANGFTLNLPDLPLLGGVSVTP